MKCNEAAEYVSALCDGERIEPEAAEHIGACDACRARMREYLEMGTELRRVASLERPAEAMPRQWQPTRATRNLWQKGWETMRIPRFAFALLMAAVVVLGSSLVVVRARPAQQKVAAVDLMVKYPGNAEPLRCFIQPKEQRSFCAQYTLHSVYKFQVLSVDDDRIEVGVRGKPWDVAVERSTPPDSAIDALPQSRYSFRAGEELKVEVPGEGTLLITAKLLDHVPSIPFLDQTLDAGLDELRIVSPVIVRDGKVVADLQGTMQVAKEGKNGGEGAFFYVPKLGRFLFANMPLKDAVQGTISQSRITFTIEGKHYILLSAVPLSRKETAWIRYEPGFRPPAENDDGHPYNGSMRLDSSILAGAEATPQ